MLNISGIAGTVGINSMILLNRISCIYLSINEICSKIIVEAVSIFKPDIFVFFDNQDVPISLKNVKEFNTDNHLCYNLTKNCFYENSLLKPRPLPYLSAIIKNNNGTSYDLTDWISTVKYSSANIPNIKRVIMAWFLKSRVLLDISLKYSVEIIDDSGNMNTLYLNDVEEKEKEKEKERDIEEIQEIQDIINKLWVKKRTV
jgi:hypothetical protein